MRQLFPSVNVKSLARLQQKYIELEQDSDEDSRGDSSTISSVSWSSYSGFVSINSLLMQRIKIKDRQANSSKPSFCKRLRSMLRINRKLQNDDDDGTTHTIGISRSPRQHQDLHYVKEGRNPKRDSHARRVQLKRRLKLLTIAEDEEFDEGLHEC